MEIGGNSRDDNRGESTNNLVWDIWELNETSRMDWTATNGTNNNYYPTAGNASGSLTRPEGGAHNALMLNPHQCLYGGDRPNLHSDPHLVCLNLGKRHYFEDSTGAGAGDYGSAMSAERRVAGFPLVKRGKPLYGGGGGSSSSSSPVIVPRCQVEGCHVALANAKDYHRRHKVCEMHSKAPKVVVLGLEQRFCQQCSRFHVVSEFEDSKRSCKRRLAGHNERRRKSSQDHSIARNSIHGRALSLLSSKSNSDDPSYFPHSDLSSRSSAALRELIAENRAAIMGRQLIVDRDWHSHNHHHPAEEHFTTTGNTNEPQRVLLSLEPNHHDHIMFGEPEPHGWDRMNGGGAHVTLDLMQAPTSAFGFVSARGKPKPEQHQSCSDFWNSFPGPNLV